MNSSTNTPNQKFRLLKSFLDTPDKIRVQADIDTYRRELKWRFDESPPNPVEKTSEESGPHPNKQLIKTLVDSLLDDSEQALRQDLVDYAWRLLNKARQIEILAMENKDELTDLRIKFKNETGKVTTHRAKTMIKLLESIEANQSLDQLRMNVFNASKILGEHFDNEGYKVMLRTRSYEIFKYILIILLILIPFLVWWRIIYISPEDTSPSQIVSVEILGLLGAAFSVLISYTRKPITGKIPQQKLIYQKTELRPFIGAAAGLVLLILFKAKLIISDGYENALYALAFVSGFSERFIIGQLDLIIEKNSDGSDKNDDKGGKKNGSAPPKVDTRMKEQDQIDL